MAMDTAKFKTIDEYIGSFPQETQEILEEVRETVRQAAPDATEKLSYAMPAFFFHGALVYFAAYKKHIGFYATPTGHEMFKEELSQYKQGKGSVQFPIDQPMPYDLIARIVRFRAKENLEKAKAPKK